MSVLGTVGLAFSIPLFVGNQMTVVEQCPSFAKCDYGFYPAIFVPIIATSALMVAGGIVMMAVGMKRIPVQPSVMSSGGLSVHF